jgi:hypothetical protein
LEHYLESSRLVRRQGRTLGFAEDLLEHVARAKEAWTTLKETDGRFHSFLVTGNDSPQRAVVAAWES